MKSEDHFEALMEGERYKLLVDAITDYAVYMLDRNGIVVSWNRGARRFKGYEADEIIGHHFSRFYTEEDRAVGLPQRALAIAASEGRFEAEGWRLRKDGTRFWTHVLIDPIHDPSGTLIGYAKVTRDLTERKQAQQAVDIAREALFQTQKLEAIGQLTGGIAHDFNNLLNVILGSLELLRKRLPDDPKAVALLDNAVNGAQRGSSLTQRMLAFARRQELETVAIELPELVRGMSDMMRRSLGPAIDIQFRFPPDLPKVRADSNQLESALLNLAVNARDAMPAGGLIVIAASEMKVGEGDGDLKPGRYVRFSMTDNGEGMDAETLARALEPFFTTKGVGKGTGLGLSMAQGIANQSGGTLTIQSRQGEGTTVEIWLPVADPADKSGARAGFQVQSDSGAGTRPLRVLAVDDDALVLMGTAALLEDLGHSVVEAGSAERALAVLRSDAEIDLVISDHAMPKMTGLQLAETIEREWPGLPFILATGYAELPQGARTTMMKLSKPFTQDQLSSVLAEAMG